ncbi:MAG TPA: hypothetical protein DCR14_20175 [Acidimicrobiaceae bacterium]|nr:hypothetical protein [Acidimicrobiaceae bacterium]
MVIVSTRSVFTRGVRNAGAVGLLVGLLSACNSDATAVLPTTIGAKPEVKAEVTTATVATPESMPASPPDDGGTVPRATPEGEFTIAACNGLVTVVPNSGVSAEAPNEGDGANFCVVVDAAGTYTVDARASYPFVVNIKYGPETDEWLPDPSTTQLTFPFTVEGAAVVLIHLNDGGDVGGGSANLNVTIG